jgi:hypothetical protein
LKLKHLIPVLLALSGAAIFSVPASAHHSTAMFKWGQGITLSGTIESFEWTQPHTWIWFDVTGKDGKMQRWGLEGMSPSHLARHGWNKHTLKKGDKVKILIYPLKDGRKGGFAVRVTYPDGTHYDEVPVQVP